jgi:chromosome segregation ATPase
MSNLFLEIQQLISQMEKLSKSIDATHNNLSNEKTKLEAIEGKLSRTEDEVKALISRHRSLRHEKAVAEKHIRGISKRLESLLCEADQLKGRFHKTMIAIANEYIGENEGVHLVNGKLAIARLRSNGKLITKLVPVMVRASPGEKPSFPVIGVQNAIP